MAETDGLFSTDNCQRPEFPAGADMPPAATQQTERSPSILESDAAKRDRAAAAAESRRLRPTSPAEVVEPPVLVATSGEDHSMAIDSKFPADAPDGQSHHAEGEDTAAGPKMDG